MSDEHNKLQQGVGDDSDEEELSSEAAKSTVEVIEMEAKAGEEVDLADNMAEVDMDDGDDDDEEAGTVVVDNSLATIKQHDGAVFCIDSYQNMLASGGEDDKLFVWLYDASFSTTNVEKVDDVIDDEDDDKLRILIESEKFADSVTNVAFSCDGKYVAAADMAGNIRVYALDTRHVHWSHSLESDIESGCLRWHPSCNVLFAGTSDGNFYMFKLATGEIKVMYGGEETSLTCFNILKDGKRAACAYQNGSVRIWDLKSASTLHNLSKAHTGDILSMDTSVDGNVLATGGTDMRLHLVNTTNGKTIANLSCETAKTKKKTDDVDEGEEGQEEDSIESVAFCKTLPMLVACATLNGALYVWDTSAQSVRAKVEHSVGFCKLVWSEQGEHLYAACLDGSVLVYDGRNLQLIKTLSGHTAEILDFSVNKALNFLITASNDGLIKVFENV